MSVFGRLSKPEQAAVLTAGAVAGVIVSGLVFVVVIAFAGMPHFFRYLWSNDFAGKKGYDMYMRVHTNQIRVAENNPMYNPPASSGTNALYANN